MNAPASLSDATFRASVVGASEVAALFDASPWLTHFELWHRKNGTIATPDFNIMAADGAPENERIHWGVELEAVIIKEACRRWGYLPLETPHVLQSGRLGGHPDKLVTDGGEKVVLEVKTVDWLQAKKWGDEPPLHYLLQNMAYQGLAGCVRGDMIVLVGGNELRRFQYEFRPKLYAEIQKRVAEFWHSIEIGKPPKPDYSRDGATIQEVIGEPGDTLIDLSRNNRAGILAADFLDAKARMKAAELEAETAKAELMEIIGDHGLAQLEGYRIACGMTKGSAGTLVTEEMVGTHVGGRKGWRQFNVKELS